MTRKTSGSGEKLPRLFVLGALGLGAMAVAYRLMASGREPMPAAVQNAGAVTEPRLSVAGAEGKLLFNRNCAACHGQNAAGTDHGPPFINAIYNPGHHGDEAFYAAARNGVRRHHWPFGDMPAQPQVERPDMAKIITYVRELQAANGIAYQPHKM